jgi:hypothetical protein
MFQLTLLDHLRFTFGHVVHRYKAHTQSAERLARLTWQIRIVELALLGGTAASATAAVLAVNGPFAMLAAALAGLSLITRAVSLALHLESRLGGHRWCAARLWLIREKYYALLSELVDGRIDLDAARERRDMLMTELHAVYEHAPLLGRWAYRTARGTLQADSEVTISDEEIDRFLPPSMRKAPSAAAAPAGQGSADPQGPALASGRAAPGSGASPG